MSIKIATRLAPITLYLPLSIDDYYGGDSSKTSETDYRESQLSHSMASTNQQILRELSRDLMQVCNIIITLRYFIVLT